MMIERHVIFHVLQDKGEEFAMFFEQEYRPAMANTEGFIKAELLRDIDNDHDYMMVLRFESLEAAAAWRESDLHQNLKPHLKSLYQGNELKVLTLVVKD